MKRLVLVLAAAALLFSISCKKDKIITSGTLTIWTQMEGIEPDIFQDMISNFQVQYPGINVEVMHYKTEDLRTGFQIAAASGKGPDLVYGPADNVGVFATLKLSPEVK